MAERIEQTLEPSEALVTVALAAVWADGREAPDERAFLDRELQRMLASSFGGVGDLGALMAQARERYVRDGVEPSLAAAAQALDQDRREQAFALASDLLMADRAFTGEEQTLFRTLQELLSVDDDTADYVLEVLLLKHDPVLEVQTDQESAPAGGPVVGPDEALVAFALAVTDQDVLPPVRALERRPIKDVQRAVVQARTGLRQWGRRTYLEACARVLTGRTRRQAFAVAADVALSDRTLRDAEHDGLVEAREVLGLPPDEAARIVDALWVKHHR